MSGPSDPTGPNDPLDPRVAELLSADLDGAVTAEEHETARRWAERSPAARAERAALAAVKAALAGLPAVDPPAGFFEAMLERGSPRPGAPTFVASSSRRRPGALVAAGAAAAAWVAVAGAGAAAVTPPVDDVEAALRSPAEHDIRLVRAGGARVAMYEQGGEVAWSRLPDGDRDAGADAVTWVDLTADAGVARVVVAADDVVLTLASEDLDAAELVAVGVGELAHRSRGGDGLVDRLRRACERLLGAG